jgi:hypothetical protein
VFSFLQLVKAIVDDASSNLHAAYDNVMNFANRMAPQTTASLRNVVDSLVGTGTPAPDSSSPSLSDALESNIRYMMADNVSYIIIVLLPTLVLLRYFTLLSPV